MRARRKKPNLLNSADSTYRTCAEVEGEAAAADAGFVAAPHKCAAPVGSSVHGDLDAIRERGDRVVEADIDDIEDRGVVFFQLELIGRGGKIGSGPVPIVRCTNISRGRRDTGQRQLVADHCHVGGGPRGAGEVGGEGVRDVSSNGDGGNGKENSYRDRGSIQAHAIHS